MTHTPFLGWDHYANARAARVNAATEARHPEWLELPASRPQAVAQGSRVYFTGQPCKHGHVTPRGMRKGCLGCYIQRHGLSDAS